MDSASYPVPYVTKGDHSNCLFSVPMARNFPHFVQDPMPPNATARIAQAPCKLSVTESGVKQVRGICTNWTLCPHNPHPCWVLFFSRGVAGDVRMCPRTCLVDRQVLRAAHSVLVLLQKGHLVLGLPVRVKEMPLIVVPHSCCCLHTCTRDELPAESFPAELQGPASMPNGGSNRNASHPRLPHGLAVLHQARYSHAAAMRHETWDK